MAERPGYWPLIGRCDDEGGGGGGGGARDGGDWAEPGGNTSAVDIVQAEHIYFYDVE